MDDSDSKTSKLRRTIYEDKIEFLCKVQKTFQERQLIFDRTCQKEIQRLQQLLKERAKSLRSDMQAKIKECSDQLEACKDQLETQKNSENENGCLELPDCPPLDFNYVIDIGDLETNILNINLKFMNNDKNEVVLEKPSFEEGSEYDIEVGGPITKNGTFFVHKIFSDRELANLELLDLRIRELILRSKIGTYATLGEVPEVGTLVFAMCASDGHWYRARVQSIVNDQVICLLLDYASQMKSSVTHLVPMLDFIDLFENCHFQLIECTIFDDCPLAVDMEVKWCFNDCVRGQILKAVPNKQIYIEERQIWNIQLFNLNEQRIDIKVNEYKSSKKSGKDSIANRDIRLKENPAMSVLNSDEGKSAEKEVEELASKDGTNNIKDLVLNESVDTSNPLRQEKRTLENSKEENQSNNILVPVVNNENITNAAPIQENMLRSPSQEMLTEPCKDIPILEHSNISVKSKTEVEHECNSEDKDLSQCKQPDESTNDLNNKNNSICETSKEIINQVLELHSSDELDNKTITEEHQQTSSLIKTDTSPEISAKCLQEDIKSAVNQLNDSHMSISDNTYHQKGLEVLFRQHQLNLQGGQNHEDPHLVDLQHVAFPELLVQSREHLQPNNDIYTNNMAHSNVHSLHNNLTGPLKSLQHSSKPADSSIYQVDSPEERIAARNQLPVEQQVVPNRQVPDSHPHTQRELPHGNVTLLNHQDRVQHSSQPPPLSANMNPQINQSYPGHEIELPSYKQGLDQRPAVFNMTSEAELHSLSYDNAIISYQQVPFYNSSVQNNPNPRDSMPFFLPQQLQPNPRIPDGIPAQYQMSYHQSKMHNSAAVSIDEQDASMSGNPYPYQSSEFNALSNGAVPTTMDTHGTVPTTIGFHGAAPTTLDTHGAVPTTMDTHGAVSTTMDTHGAVPTTMDTHGAVPTTMDTHGAVSTNMDTHGAVPTTMDTHGAVPTTKDTHGAGRTIVGSQGACPTIVGSHGAVPTTVGTHGGARIIVGSHGAVSTTVGALEVNVSEAIKRNDFCGSGSMSDERYEKGSTFKGTLCGNLSDNGLFYVNKILEGMEKTRFDTMFSTFQYKCRYGSKTPERPQQLSIGQYLGVFYPRSNNFQRGRLQEIKLGRATVVLLDKGETVRTHLQDLRVMPEPPEAFSYPPQALACRFEDFTASQSSMKLYSMLADKQMEYEITVIKQEDCLTVLAEDKFSVDLSNQLQQAGTTMVPSQTDTRHHSSSQHDIGYGPSIHSNKAKENYHAVSSSKKKGNTYKSNAAWNKYPSQQRYTRHGASEEKLNNQTKEDNSYEYKSLSNLMCYACHSTGHKQKDCPQKKYHMTGQQSEKSFRFQKCSTCPSNDHTAKDGTHSKSVKRKCKRSGFNKAKHYGQDAELKENGRKNTASEVKRDDNCSSQAEQNVKVDLNDGSSKADDGQGSKNAEANNSGIMSDKAGGDYRGNVRPVKENKNPK